MGKKQKHDPMDVFVCPQCGKFMHLGSKTFLGTDACHCDHGNIDKAMQIVGGADIITPVSSATGMSPVTCFVILCIIGLIALAIAASMK